MLFNQSELSNRNAKDVYLCFINYTKAFNKVWHRNLFELLEKLCRKDIRITDNIYYLWIEKKLST